MFIVCSGMHLLMVFTDCLLFVFNGMYLSKVFTDCSLNVFRKYLLNTLIHYRYKQYMYISKWWYYAVEPAMEVIPK